MAEVRYDDAGWPIIDCPTCGSPMGWLGAVFFICFNGKAHKLNRIFVVTGEREEAYRAGNRPKKVG